MANASLSLFEVAGNVREAYKLLDNNQGNNGRALRRFIKRHAGCVNGQVVFVQSFCFEDGYSRQQLEAINAYAQTIDDENVRLFPKELAYRRVGTSLDADFEAVSNSYVVTADVQTASVRELRDLVHVVLVLNDTLQQFVRSPNETALQACPDYAYRNLPCNCAPAPWAIGGEDKQGGSGVLEWCIDEADALERLALMQAHPSRFLNLCVSSPAALGMTA